MSRHLKDPLIWLHGLLSGIIGGASVTGSSYIGTLVANQIDNDVQVLKFKTLGIIMLVSAISSALAYLSKSPLPALESRDTTHITKADIKD
jgi:uncharacterized membrane protein YqgA involved in biofilm formation